MKALRVHWLIWLLLCSSVAVQSEPTTERIQQLKGEIARWEARCVPAAGTTRADVERKFGPGQPVSPSKVPLPTVRTNSLFRAYDFCTNGTLWIHYDEAWHVERADYVDPYQLKGLSAGTNIEPEQELETLEQRLQQMKRIAAEYEKRFGKSSKAGIEPTGPPNENQLTPPDTNPTSSAADSPR